MNASKCGRCALWSVAPLTLALVVTGLFFRGCSSKGGDAYDRLKSSNEAVTARNQELNDQLKMETKARGGAMPAEGAKASSVAATGSLAGSVGGALPSTRTENGFQNQDANRGDPEVLPSDFSDFTKLKDAAKPGTVAPAPNSPPPPPGEAPTAAPGRPAGSRFSTWSAQQQRRAKPSDRSEASGEKLADEYGRLMLKDPARPAGQGRAFARLPDIAGSLPSQSEELWIIQKYRAPQVPPADDEMPGTGCLLGTVMDNPQAKQVPVPLKHTDVRADIAGYIASVRVKQEYTNPFSSKIEAVYLFPLPENAAVNDFIMTIGDRRIRGIIRDRAEAEQIYTEARAQGHVASLLTQERPNIFAQKVANIEPGKQIDIDITYFHTLQYIDGAFEWVFPMVVGPRFNPAGFYDGVGAAPRGQPGSTGQATEVQYLKPAERSGHDVAVTVNIDAGAGINIEKVWSNSHAIRQQGYVAAAKHVGDGEPPAVRTRTTVWLSDGDRIPNKDFVLRWQVAGRDVRTGVVTCRGPDGADYFSLMLVPPAELQTLARQPVEMIFVLDCSGSMSGDPIRLAVGAAERGLRRLEKDDTFQIINFANTASQLGAAPLPASPANVERGSKYLQGLFAEGGTYMINGIRASLDFPHDPGRLRVVVFLTDAYIGNETEILSEIDARLGPSRIFSVGVGSSTNRYLLDAMAKLGRGAVAHIAVGDSPVEVMDRFFDRISHPALTDLRLEIAGGRAEGVEVYPRQLPDVFVGRPVIITGRILGGLGRDEVVHVRGKVGGVERDVAAPVGGVQTTHSALPALWARRKIADMADYATFEQLRELPGVVKDVALRYNLMSAYTAFVAVDSLSHTAGSYGTTVVQPVPVPEGVRYDTTVAK